MKLSLFYSRRHLHILAGLASLLCFFVVPLGAFVRLSDAGLGCPDWPGCYGHYIGVPKGEAAITQAVIHFPHSPVDIAKAWKEMVHRYVAGFLGLLILALAWVSWQTRIDRALSLVVLATVTFQAMLGMWTVTLLLKPVIVTAHLLGGMTTLALLVTLWFRTKDTGYGGYTQTQLRFGQAAHSTNTIKGLALLSLIVVFFQIMLGGWVSSNYAALACTGFPACSGSYLPDTNFSHGFSIFRHLGQTVDGQDLPVPALIAIHWSHRIGALVVAFVVGYFAIRLLRYPLYRQVGLALAIVLSLQITLGILNVLWLLPLPIAVAHNLFAAILLCLLLVINFRLR